MTSLPAYAALKERMLKNWDQPASECLGQMVILHILAVCKSS